MLKMIKKLFNKEKKINIYLGPLKVTSITEKAIKMTREEGIERFFFVAWDAKHTAYVKFGNIKLEKIPHIDDQTSNAVYFNIKSGQIEEVVYVVDGLSKSQIKMEKPYKTKFVNGKAVLEIYTPFLLFDNLKEEYSTRTGENSFELNSYSIPYQIFYKENGVIDEDKSMWKFNTSQTTCKTMTFKQYKEVLKDININLYNFKNHTKLERKIIHMYMNIGLYEKEFEELGIEAKRESLLANYKVIAMYYL